MITPAYAPTATERVLPRLALDFTTGVLDPRVAVTRTLNTATRVNSSGFIEVVNANLPRFDYDPVTLAPKGLLIEEQRTNLTTYSQQFDNAAWAKSDATVSADAVTSPDGTVNADSLVENTATAAHSVYRSAGSLTGAHTASCYVKPAGRSWCYMEPLGNSATRTYFNLSGSGSVGTTGSGVTASISAVGNGWYRISTTYTYAAQTGWFVLGGATANATPSYTGNGTAAFHMYGAQLEAGAFATSYIPTTTTSLTRNADVVTMTGTNFSSWFNASEGTLSFEGSIFVDQGATTVDFIQVSNGVSNSISIDLAMFGANAPVFQVSNSGTQCSIDTGTLTVNTVFKMVGAYKENAFVAAMNGQSPGVDNSGTIPSGLVRMGIGNRLSGPLMNGHARKIAYWPQRLINAETQAFSKG